MMKILLAFAMLTPALTPNMDTGTTGQMRLSDLRKICMAADEPNRNACQYYIMGAVDGIEAYAGTTDAKPRICLPADNAAGQLVQLVRDMMQKDLILYPADKDLRAASFVEQTIEHFFTCSKPASAP